MKYNGSMKKGSAVSFRIDTEDYEKVKKTAAMFGANVSTFSRMAVVYFADMMGEVLPKIKEMEPEKIIELAERYKEIQA